MRVGVRDSQIHVFQSSANLTLNWSDYWQTSSPGHSYQTPFVGCFANNIHIEWEQEAITRVIVSHILSVSFQVILPHSRRCWLDTYNFTFTTPRLHFEKANWSASLLLGFSFCQWSLLLSVVYCRENPPKGTLKTMMIIYNSKEKQLSGWQGWPSGESTCLPPMWPGLDFRTRRQMWTEFVGSLLCYERFFPGYSGFPLSPKTNIPFDL